MEGRSEVIPSSKSLKSFGGVVGGGLVAGGSGVMHQNTHYLRASLDTAGETRR